MSVFKRLMILLCIGGSVGGFFCLSFLYDAYWKRPVSGALVVEVDIAPGTNASELGTLFKSSSLISDTRQFGWYLRFSDRLPDLKAGHFSLTQGLSYDALLDVVTKMAPGSSLTLTIPEGFTLKQIKERLQKALPNVTDDEWNTMVGPQSPVCMEFALCKEKPTSVDLEGYLFPDTYAFQADANAEMVVRSMIATLERRMKTTGIDVVKSALNPYSFHERLTLASILEKEVRQEETMKNVADIFLKRLDRGIPLQADSTVNYATGGNRPSVTYDDLKINSPYNTYAVKGLPPGPISSPGLTAILAAYHPIQNGYWYFLTTPQGEVKYASTFEQHVANKRAFLP